MARLEMCGVEVQFGEVAALRGVDLDVPEGSVTGLVGAPGAGKTTALNVITGVQKAQAGTVTLDGMPVGHLPPHRRARLGIARTFERLEAFGSLSVRDNILAAAEIRRRWARDDTNPRRIADDIVRHLGLREIARVRCSSLAPGLARLVEVGRALATRPRVLLLDEPSAGLGPQDVERLCALLRALAGDGMAIVVVEQDVDVAVGGCDTLHVLDDGQLVASGTAGEIGSGDAVRSLCDSKSSVRDRAAAAGPLTPPATRARGVLELRVGALA